MVLVLHLAAVLLASVSFANIKNVTPKNDEIIEVKTALGIATIIQMPDTVQSAIMGDQSAYRIEYVDRAVTIKPLRGSARTNLYLFTKEKRYNLRLTVVPQALAYYIIYIRKVDFGVGTQWTSLTQSTSNSDIVLKLLKVGTTRDGFLLLNLSVTARKALTLEPENFWVLQGDSSRVLQSLFLSRKSLKKDQIAFVGISIKRSDLLLQGLTLEVRKGQKPVRLDLVKALVWK
ncbi:TrbG/VirB9 family P-type conjugative transfer protein [Bdellovibrio bacteriovorus]|uniref:TrbG/VirB9 family P-type conjugative transfer protein n=1 Tax=Bdellovibrio bacteriovorus TaxID=959 RepID=UPI003A80CCE4